MTTENNAASGAAEQLAPVSTEPTPDLVDPGVTDDTGLNDEVISAEATATEKTPEQKELERMRRQLTKRDRTQGKLHQELQAERSAREALERRLQSRPAEGDDGENQPADPNQGLSTEEIQQLVNQRAQDMNRVQRLNEKANTIYEQGAKKFKDFKDAVNAVIEETPLFDDKGPTALMEAVFDADEPAAVLHYLGKNPEIAAGLEGLTATQITRRLVRIELDMKEAAKPKTSTAPKPLTPVNAAASSATPDPSKDAAAWIKWRNEQSTKT